MLTPEGCTYLNNEVLLLELPLKFNEILYNTEIKLEN